MPILDTINISAKEKDSALRPAKKQTFLQRLRHQKNVESSTESEPQANENKTNTLESNDSQSLAQVLGGPEKANADVGMRERFRRALSKTGRSFSDLFFVEQEIDEELLEDLETRLLLADVGVETTVEIMEELTSQLKRKELIDGHGLLAALQNILINKLVDCQKSLEICSQKPPFVILVVGVNGVGKTTTIGKIAKYYGKQEKTVMLAAGDTFRAAAVEQLQDWGKKNNIPVVAQGEGADSASVIFDAIGSAKSHGVDILIADTAGRLHTKNYLMEELKKVRRVIAKLDDSAPHEVLLVIDAGTGQNAMNQMQAFNNAVAVTGLVLTKLDGTAKGGIIFSLCKRFGVPVRFVGLGENLEDLQPFDARNYVEALLSSDNKNV
jgi:fused signal recognition particle receptor|tara:strand:- start:10403 stop:11548 length:1146 start_codon:yes stop_codon:yes gene_type:complete